MLKKTIITFLLSIIFILAINGVNAIGDCNITRLASGAYQASSTALIVNTSVSVSSGENITNVTFTIRNTEFTNGSLNGTSAPLAQSVFHGFPIDISSITSGNSIGVRLTCYNQTDNRADSSKNSSANLTWNLDFTNPLITIQQPNSGETVSAKGTGLVTFGYTPTDINLGNSTLYIDGQTVKSSISETTSSNITSGAKATFTNSFSANNNSITFIVELTDLAGNQINSSSRTFNVFVQGAAEPVEVFVTPSGEVISTPAQPKGKAITKPLTFGNIGKVGNLLSSPLIWGGTIIFAVGLFIWRQSRKKIKS